MTSPMNTSGPAPPEICVSSVARVESVLVGAASSVTLIFGYFFSKALIHAVRRSLFPTLIGLDHQTIFPDIALPGGPDARGDEADAPATATPSPASAVPATATATRVRQR